jgi:hypothetical protein
MTDLKRAVSPEHLRVARIEVSGDPSLQALFIRARDENLEESWLADNLAVRLSARWGGTDFEIATEVAAVLAHEVYEFPDKPLAIVDRQGTVIGRYSPNDVYQPVPVARESGNMVEPLPRLRPEIEGALVTRVHNLAREEAGLEAMTARVGQTAIQREDGDQRFDLYTWGGRQRILEEFPARLRERVIENRSTHLELLSLIQDVAPVGVMATTFNTPIQLIISLRDLQAVNLRSSIHNRIVDAVVGEWTRFIGTLYMTSPINSVTTETLETLANLPCRAWVAPAELAVPLRRLAPDQRVLAVPHWGPVVRVTTRSTIVRPDFERLQIDRFEYNDRWVLNILAPLQVWWAALGGLTSYVITRPPPDGYTEVVP